MKLRATCANCKQIGYTQTCGKRRTVKYCSVACQKADWPAHKLQCVPNDDGCRESVKIILKKQKFNVFQRLFTDILRDSLSTEADKEKILVVKYIKEVNQAAFYYSVLPKEKTAQFREKEGLSDDLLLMLLIIYDANAQLEGIKPVGITKERKNFQNEEEFQDMKNTLQTLPLTETNPYRDTFP